MVICIDFSDFLYIAMMICKEKAIFYTLLLIKPIQPCIVMYQISPFAFVIQE
jgi:hypothetical protein